MGLFVHYSIRPQKKIVCLRSVSLLTLFSVLKMFKVLFLFVLMNSLLEIKVVKGMQ